MLRILKFWVVDPDFRPPLTLGCQTLACASFWKPLILPYRVYSLPSHMHCGMLRFFSWDFISASIVQWQVTSLAVITWLRQSCQSFILQVSLWERYVCSDRDTPTRLSANYGFLLVFHPLNKDAWFRGLRMTAFKIRGLRTYRKFVLARFKIVAILY